MAHGEISEVLPANSSVVFDLLHDYKRRLEWDTLLSAAYLEDGHEVAAKAQHPSASAGVLWAGSLCGPFTSPFNLQLWRR